MKVGEGFPGGSLVKNPTKAGDRGLIPRQQDPLEKEMTTHSSILALEIPWTEEPGGLQSMGSKSQARLKQLAQNRWYTAHSRSFLHSDLRSSHDCVTMSNLPLCLEWG